MPTKLISLPMDDLPPSLFLEKGRHDKLRTPAELQEIIDDCIHDMKDTTHKETVTQCRAQLREI